MVDLPSGAVARPTLKGAWKNRPVAITGTELAHKYQIDVLPMHVKGLITFCDYPWYLILNLRIMIFPELIDKAGQQYELTIGSPLSLVTVRNKPRVAFVGLIRTKNGTLNLIKGYTLALFAALAYFIGWSRTGTTLIRKPDLGSI